MKTTPFLLSPLFRRLAATRHQQLAMRCRPAAVRRFHYALQRRPAAMHFCRYVLLLAVLSPAALFGNAGFFDNSGAGITLGGTDKIQMVSEVVEISFSPADGPVTGDLKHRDKAHYKCRFVLKNLSDETVTALVGFPLIGEGRRPDPKKHPEVKEYFLKHYGFTAQSADTVYAVREHFNKGASPYRQLLVWDMKFAPNATVELEVSYSIYGYNGLGSTEKKSPYFNTSYGKIYLEDLQGTVTQMYPYVTQTAASWAGQVESAEFIIHHADFEYHLQKRGALEDDPTRNIPESRRQEVERSFAAIKNGTFYRYISAGNWQPAADGTSLRWTEAPFTEHQDFEIRYIFSVLPKDAKGFTLLLENIETDHNDTRSRLLKHIERVRSLNKPDMPARIEKTTAYLNEYYPAPFADADRKNVADAVLEFYGIATGNPDIADFLERQNWYPVTEPRTIDADLKAELLRWHNIGQTQGAALESAAAAVR